MGATADGDWCPNCGSPHCSASCYYGGKQEDSDSALESDTESDSYCPNCDIGVCSASGCPHKQPKERMTSDEEKEIELSLEKYRQEQNAKKSSVQKREIGDTLGKVVYVILFLLGCGFLLWIVLTQK